MGSNRRDGDAGKKKKAKKDGSAPAHDSNGGAGIITDSRFASVQSDPRFQKVPRHKAKVEIDSRFDRIFTDRRFGSSSAPVDKRGKPRRSQDSENPLKHYYRIEESREKNDEGEESEEESEEEEARKGEELAKRGREELETELSGESEASESEEDDSEGLESDATSDTDEDEDEDEGLVYRLDDEPEAPVENIPEIEKETHRLAVVNMDWRYVKATDLYMMLSSFLPKNGQILSVAIYPSEFGLERMKEEELHGPVGLFDDEDEKKDDDSEDDDDNDKLDDEILRAYEKSRLRYYYAVVECDSVATADYLYKACDGIEFERSSNVLDLRFIPDSLEFKHPPRDVAKEAPANYEGLNFETRALQQSKIHLSWDEDEPERVKTMKRKFNAEQLEELELKEYLASESESDESESDENEENNAAEDKTDKKQKKRELYRALLESGPSGDASDGDGEEKDDKDQDMEVTFNTGLENISKRILEKKDRKQETVWEAHLREKREKKKLRRRRSKNSSDDESSDTDQDAVEEPGDFFIEEPSVKKRKKSDGKSAQREKQEQDTKGEREVTKEELELLLADDTITDTGLKGYNLKRKKVKGKDRKKAKEILEEDEIPPIVDDPRFSSLFTSPDFALDPTDPQFKRSATYARQIALRKQKYAEESAEGLVPAELHSNKDEQVKSDDRSSNKNKYELSNGIRSVKMRCHQIKAHSNGKASKKDDSLQSSEKKMKKKDKKIRDSDLNLMLQSVKRRNA